MKVEVHESQKNAHKDEKDTIKCVIIEDEDGTGIDVAIADESGRDTSYICNISGEGLVRYPHCGPFIEQGAADEDGRIKLNE